MLHNFEWMRLGFWSIETASSAEKPEFALRACLSCSSIRQFPMYDYGYVLMMMIPLLLLELVGSVCWPSSKGFCPERRVYSNHFRNKSECGLHHPPNNSPTINTEPGQWRVLMTTLRDRNSFRLACNYFRIRIWKSGTGSVCSLYLRKVIMANIFSGQEDKRVINTI